MTIFDTTNEFSDDQAITVNAASTNQIDRGAPGTPVGGAAALNNDWGAGKPIPIEIMVTEAFAGTATALQVEVEVDNDVAFGSPKVVWDSGAVAKAGLVVGYRFKVGYLPEGVDERYIRLNYTLTGTPFSAGKISAGIVGGLQTNR
jgi:hypothetical protein